MPAGATILDQRDSGLRTLATGYIGPGELTWRDRIRESVGHFALRALAIAFGLALLVGACYLIWEGLQGGVADLLSYLVLAILYIPGIIIALALLALAGRLAERILDRINGWFR